LVALTLLLVPIKFHLHVEEISSALAVAEIHDSRWEHRVFLFLEATALGCFTFVLLSSRRAYLIAIAMSLCHLGVLMYWYYQLMSRRLYPRLTLYSLFFSEEAANTFYENTENFVQLGLALLLIGLVVGVVLRTRRVDTCSAENLGI
jgi:hypothetical protein